MKYVNGVVYIIYNCINGMRYIGRDAYNNPKYLGGGTRLRSAQKKYGKDKFMKLKLRECHSARELIYWEQYYLNLYDASNNPSFYNISDNSAGGAIPPSKPVYQYTLNGDYITRFDSALTASIKYGVHRNSICMAALGKCKSIKGFLWSYQKCNKVSPIRPRAKIISHRKHRIVYCYNMDGNYVCAYESIIDAAKRAGVSKAYVCRCVYKNLKRAHKRFNVLFSFDCVSKIKLPQPFINVRCRPVLQYDKNKAFIKGFYSIMQAEMAMGITHAGIRNVLAGSTRTSCGFIWKYKEEAA